MIVDLEMNDVMNDPNGDKWLEADRYVIRVTWILILGLRLWVDKKVSYLGLYKRVIIIIIIVGNKKITNNSSFLSGIGSQLFSLIEVE